MHCFKTKLLFVVLIRALLPGLAEARAEISIEDLLRTRTALSTKISPDGNSVLFTLASPDLTDNVRRLSLWKVDAGAQPVKLMDGARNPRWSPDGKQIAYLSRHEGTLQIWTSDAAATNPFQLTSLSTDVLDFEWSPDGTSMALLAASNGKTGLHVLNLRSRELRLLTTGGDQLIRVDPWNPDANASWSPDSRWIAYSAKPSPLFDDEYRTDLYVISVAKGTATRLTHRDGMDTRPVWSPNGRFLAFRASFGKRDRYADHGISILDMDTKEIRDIPNPGCGFLDGPYWYDWSADGNSLYYLMPHRASVQFFELSVREGTSRQISHGPGVYSRPSHARNVGKMAFLFSDTKMPWEVHVSSTSVFQPVRWTRMNPELEKTRSVDLESIRWKSSDGLEIEGLLAYPANYAKENSYPLLTIVHGGPEGFMFPAFSPEVPFPLGALDPLPYQIFSAAGYAVFLPNFRGSGSYGSDFRLAGSDNWSAGYAMDILSGIDSIVQKGIADPKRLVIGGTWRSGSTKVAGLLSKTDRFRAAVALTPYPDLAAMYESNQDFRLQHEGLLGGSPQTAPEAYQKHSPIVSAHLIRTPTLIFHDENDWFIQSSQSMALHEILKKNQVPGELILHRSFGPIEEAELIQKILLWLNRVAVVQ